MERLYSIGSNAAAALGALAISFAVLSATSRVRADVVNCRPCTCVNGPSNACSNDPNTDCYQCYCQQTGNKCK
jgi:hypothetical protein